MTGHIASFGALFETREEWETWAKSMLARWGITIGGNRVRDSAALHGYAELAEELIRIELAERML